MNYADKINSDVRLIVLRALYNEPDYSLNSSILTKILEEFGHVKSRDYVHNQLRYLEREVQALTLRSAGSILIAQLTQSGRDHVERRCVLTGVDRPSPEA
ncbi:hypothetical protein [Polycladidibacter stylochi]|uniref:VpaChn25_0724 family phage protein n=1 Tax=Polycladidibacter stylochi TaxID=1807766 RepID=UPI00082E2DF6|nr:hypothetical protein [Pseudovibrio stylochi]